MFLELVATFVIGFGAAGIILILNWISGGRLPRALLPIGAGLAMIGFTVWSEYSWFPRNLSQLPEDAIVLRTVEKQSFYQPWTYVRPFVNRMLVAHMSTLEAGNNTVFVQVSSLERWGPTRANMVGVDCAESRTAIFGETIQFDDQGEPIGAVWAPLEEGDPLLEAVCT